MPSVLGGGQSRVAQGLRRRGQHWHRHQRDAFFCSNRYSNTGCGRTFSVHWDSVIPHCSLRTDQLLKLIEAVAAGATVHSAWQQGSQFPLSLTSAYRWIKRWRLGTAGMRALLCLLEPPPDQQSGTSTDWLTLQHLASAFPATLDDLRCRIGAFQCHFQTAIS